MKVWEDFKPIGEFRNKVMKKRRCWSRCHLCKGDFKDSKKVHMIVVDEGTRFIDDKCLKKWKES